MTHFYKVNLRKLWVFFVLFVFLLQLYLLKFPKISFTDWWTIQLNYMNDFILLMLCDHIKIMNVDFNSNNTMIHLQVIYRDVIECCCLNIITFIMRHLPQVYYFMKAFLNINIAHKCIVSLEWWNTYPFMTSYVNHLINWYDNAIIFTINNKDGTSVMSSIMITFNSITWFLYKDF